MPLTGHMQNKLSHLELEYLVEADIVKKLKYDMYIQYFLRFLTVFK